MIVLYKILDFVIDGYLGAFAEELVNRSEVSKIFKIKEMPVIDFFKRYLPIVKADEGEEELVDPQKVLRVSDIIIT